MVRAELGGILPRNFAGRTAPALVYEVPPAPEYSHQHTVEIEDARPLQSTAASAAAFFGQHGFALVPHSTAVRDWDREVVRVYHREIKAVVREQLFPDKRVRVAQSASVIRRGQGKRFYARFVHSDGPLTADLYAANLGLVGPKENERWFRNAYGRDDVAGMASISLWRTINMSAPLRHLPLALCDPASVDAADFVPNTMVGTAPDGLATHHVALRFNPAQRWYYYPEVTGSELIAFKLCQFWKDDPEAPPQNVFHSAFEDPTAPAEAEERQSCDHRVTVFILRD